MSLLFIDCCISVHTPSRTQQLRDAFLRARRTAFPDEVIDYLDLTAFPMSPLNAGDIERRNALVDEGATGAMEFAPARQFAAADAIVIAAPYWELSFPALLRVYLEHIAVLNITFGYTPSGEPRGLCRAGELLYLTTAGGSVEGQNWGADYLSALCCGMLGAKHFRCIAAENQDVRGGNGAALLAEACAAAAETAKKL